MPARFRASAGQPARPVGRVDETLWAIRSALPAGGLVTVSARQDRHHAELSPSWTLQISGPLVGTEFSIELSGPILGQLLDDAIETLVTLGVDIPDESQETGANYTPVSMADPDSYPA